MDTQSPPVVPADTSFRGCWEQLVRDRGLPEDPLALLPPTTMAEARRAAMEIFSWGGRHQELTRRRCERLFPTAKIDAERLRREIQSLKLTSAAPQTSAHVVDRDGEREVIYQPSGRLF